MEVAIRSLILHFPPRAEVSGVWIDLGESRRKYHYAQKLDLFSFDHSVPIQAAIPCRLWKNEGT